MIFMKSKRLEDTEIEAIDDPGAHRNLRININGQQNTQNRTMEQ